MKPIVLYDMTRIITRRMAATPTGIDRVDIRYAVELLHSDQVEVALLRQDGSKLVLLDKQSTEDFLICMNTRWTQGSSDPAPVPPADAE